MLRGDLRCPSVQGDLWVKMAELIRGASEDFFRCSWNTAGVLTGEEAARQANADSLATQWARLCHFDPVWLTMRLRGYN